MLKKILLKTHHFMLVFGVNVIDVYSLKNIPKYLKDRKKWLSAGGEISSYYPMLKDYNDFAGSSKGHYFHQDLLVAGFVFGNNPKRHIDVGSRIDGFCAHVAAFRKIEIMDIRDLPESSHPNIKFIKSNLMVNERFSVADSISCLHAIEHFGLGRYTDPININGHIDGINNLVDMLENDGRLYISFPIGKHNQTLFNAHRIFHPEYIFEIESVKDNLTLERFDYVNDSGDLICDVPTAHALGKVDEGCGIYTFRKVSREELV
jgi:hypothetical protein